MRHSESIYPSKVDVWLVIVLIAAPLLVIGFGFYFGDLAAMILIPVGLLMAVSFAALAIPCRYRLTDTLLIIRCGVLRERIKLQNIRDAVPTGDPLSAPALSLKRVKIVMDKGFRLISPREQERFICELKKKIHNG
jgi:hypothetical protein